MTDANTVRITKPASGSGGAVVTPMPVALTPPPVLGTPVHRSLGEFRLLDELGRGGMGIVYRAVESRLGREVALKVLNESHASSPESRARFQREAKAQAAVDHENVVPIFRVGEADGVPFLTMPVLKGVSLATYLKANSKPPLSVVLRIGRELAEGLAAAHEKGLIHRDVKPGNVWLDGATGRVKILDFGLARELAPTDETSDPVTCEGVTVGTTEYMSPEQARGEPLDSRTDLFSLGAVLYELATGQRPFKGPNKGAAMARLLSNTPTAPHELNPAVPASLSDLIVSLLEKEPKDRPASAEAVAATLARIELGKPVAKKRTSRRRWVLGVVGLGAVAAAYLVAAPWLGLPVPGSKPDLNRPETFVRMMLRDFDRVYVRDAEGRVLPLQFKAEMPPAPFEPVSLEFPSPHAANELRRKLSDGIPGPMRSVRHIDLQGTPATAEDVAWFAELLPWCEIRWVGGAVGPKERD